MDELMLSAIQGTIFIMSFVYSKQTLYHKAFEEAVLDWGLNPGPLALKANTLPQGF